MTPNTIKSNNRLIIGAVAVIAVLVTTDVACGGKTPPPQTPADTSALVDCVEKRLEAGDTSVFDIANACQSQAIPVVTDVTSTLVKAQRAERFRMAEPHDGGLDSH